MDISASKMKINKHDGYIEFEFINRFYKFLIVDEVTCGIQSACEIIAECQLNQYKIQSRFSHTDESISWWKELANRGFAPMIFNEEDIRAYHLGDITNELLLNSDQYSFILDPSNELEVYDTYITHPHGPIYHPYSGSWTTCSGKIYPPEQQPPLKPNILRKTC